MSLKVRAKLKSIKGKLIRLNVPGDQAGSSAVDLILRMFAGIGIMIGAGYLLDRMLGTTPWFIIAGTVCGVTVAFIDLYFQGKKRST